MIPTNVGTGSGMRCPDPENIGIGSAKRLWPTRPGRLPTLIPTYSVTQEVSNLARNWQPQTITPVFYYQRWQGKFPLSGRMIGRKRSCVLRFVLQSCDVSSKILSE